MKLVKSEECDGMKSEAVWSSVRSADARGGMKVVPSARSKKAKYIKAVALKLLPFSFLSLVASAAVAESPQCERFKIRPEPLNWISSIEALPYGGQLLVASPGPDVENSIHFYGADGKLTANQTGASVPGHFVPVLSSESSDRQYLYKSSSKSITWLDSNLDESENLIEFDNSLDTDSFSVSGYYEFVVAGETLVGYGAVTRNRTEIYGFIAQDLNSPHEHELIYPLSNGEYYYQTVSPYLVAVGSKVYFIAMDRSPELLVYDTREKDLTILNDFPFEDYKTPIFANTGSEIGDFKRLEEFDGLPSGLFASYGLLYVLSRPESALDQWQLTVLKPTDRAVKTIAVLRLPTRAAHVRMAIGYDAWSLFESSRVRASPEDGPGRASFDFGTLVRIPAHFMNRDLSVFAESEVKCLGGKFEYR